MLRARTALMGGVLLTLAWLGIYFSTVSPTVNLIDSGELITAVWGPGIAHPPGYPLYTLLGYVATHLPVGEIAWRLNAFSALWAALAVAAFYFLVIESFVLTVPVAQSPRPTAARRGTRQQSQPQTVQEMQLPSQVPAAVLIVAAATASLLGA
ncbi:MAG TPA: DUF2723 domain-containing protein, partial [Chloroflexia bacterium]|nr:DUF2723 domain-containing protein [Chloroflexia bacterium]